MMPLEAVRRIAELRFSATLDREPEVELALP
jgi:hypothetical protein